MGLALLAPMQGAAQEWWQGIWAFDPAWCAQAGRIGAVTPAPIAITPDEMLGYEMSCEITGTRAMEGVGAVHLLLSCQSEGDRFDEERLVMRSDLSARAIWIWFGAGEPIRFSGCE